MSCPFQPHPSHWVLQAQVSPFSTHSSSPPRREQDAREMAEMLAAAGCKPTIYQ